MSEYHWISYSTIKHFTNIHSTWPHASIEAEAITRLCFKSVMYDNRMSGVNQILWQPINQPKTERHSSIRNVPVFPPMYFRDFSSESRPFTKIRLPCAFPSTCLIFRLCRCEAKFPP